MLPGGAILGIKWPKHSVQDVQQLAEVQALFLGATLERENKIIHVYIIVLERATGGSEDWRNPAGVGYEDWPLWAGVGCGPRS